MMAREREDNVAATAATERRRPLRSFSSQISCMRGSIEIGPRVVVGRSAVGRGKELEDVEDDHDDNDGCATDAAEALDDHGGGCGLHRISLIRSASTALKGTRLRKGRRLFKHGDP